MSAQSQVMKEAAEMAKKAIGASYKGETATGFSKAINGVLNNGFGAAEAAGRFMGGEGMGALTKTFGKEFDAAGKVTKWNAGKIAGSYIGAAAAGRVLTGGGIYKDGNGSTNLVGVPFV